MKKITIKDRSSAARAVDAFEQHVGGRLENLQSTIKDLAERAAAEIRTRLKDGTFKLEPNSPEYAAWKKRMGHGDKPLVDTGAYADSIKAKQVGDFDWMVAPDDTITHPSGLKMSQLGRIHEYGTTDGIPARPHFLPIRRKYERLLARKLKDGKA